MDFMFGYGWLSVTGGAAILAAALIVAGAWVATREIRRRAFHVDHDPDQFDLRVTAVENGLVTVRGANRELRRNGSFGLQWPGGCGRMDEIVAVDGDTVTRRWSLLEGELATGDSVRLDVFAMPHDPLRARGIAFREVTYRAPLGETPSWLIEGERESWLIQVHGKGSEPGEGLRMLPAAVKLGMPVLAIQYRNDAAAPSIDGDRYHYGATEWADLEAAVQYALDEGARDVIVAAHSMGGGIALSFVERSPLAEHVSALILDAPMLQLPRTIDLGIRESVLPAGLAGPLRTLTGWRAGIDFNAVDYLSRAGELRVPVLLFHGDEDDIIPVELSREFAAARPDLVTYIEAHGLGHTQAWNGDPEAYERAVSEFLADRLQ